MRVPRNAQVELCAGDDPSRAVLHHVYLDTTTPNHAFLVSTDGRVMAIVPVTLEEGDEQGFVTTESLKAARKLTTAKAETFSLSANGCLKLTNGVSFPRPTEGEYPNWRQVLPDTANRKVSIALNAELLVKLQRALGADGVTLHIQDDKSPMLVAPSAGVKTEAFGVLMPMRTN